MALWQVKQCRIAKFCASHGSNVSLMTNYCSLCAGKECLNTCNRSACKAAPWKCIDGNGEPTSACYSLVVEAEQQYAPTVGSGDASDQTERQASEEYLSCDKGTEQVRMGSLNFLRLQQ